MLWFCFTATHLIINHNGQAKFYLIPEERLKEVAALPIKCYKQDRNMLRKKIAKSDPVPVECSGNAYR
jgi:hypothetical protein